MCGIAGVFAFIPDSDSAERIRNMANALAHRGPDADGFYFDHEHVALGHRRLSIIDLSVQGTQPMSDCTGRYVIVFNGEIYNYKEIKEEIGYYKYRSGTDTEVILAAFLKWGVACINKLHGMFAFAMWDSVDKVLFLVRDRLGVKPLYYHNNNRQLLFASEIRSLLKSGGIPGTIDKDGLYEFLNYQAIGGSKSLIQGIKQVRPGTYLRIDENGVVQRSYWVLSEVEPKHEYSSPIQVKKQIYILFCRSVERRMISDVPVGAFLSGGIDSSAIVAAMARISGERPSTFTASFDEAEFDESTYASLVAKKFNTIHRNIKFKPKDFLDDLIPALDAMDTVSGDGINTFVISKAIKNSGISVALSGLGGDEIFGGYSTFKTWNKFKRYESIWNHTFQIRKLMNLMTPTRSGRTDRIKGLLGMRKMNISSFYPFLRQVLSDKQLSCALVDVQVSKPDFEMDLESSASKLRKFPVSGQMSVAELAGYTQSTLLKDTDQMSMAVSLEIREPFFDHELIEFMLWVPEKMRRHAFPKGVFVEALNGLLPAEIFKRKKQGFVFPWKMWLKTELRSFGEEHLRRLCERDFINEKFLMNYWRGFLKGDPSIRWADLWLFIVLEYWLERNNINA